MHKKGFALLETLIVSTVILSILIFLYIQFINLRQNYEESFKYNTIPGLYMANTIADCISETGFSTTNKPTLTNDKPYAWLDSTYLKESKTYNKLIEKSEVKSILITRSNIVLLQNYLKTNNDINFSSKLKKFILRIKTNEPTGYRIIIEYKNGTFATVLGPSSL